MAQKPLFWPRTPHKPSKTGQKPPKIGPGPPKNPYHRPGKNGPKTPIFGPPPAWTHRKLGQKPPKIGQNRPPGPPRDPQKGPRDPRRPPKKAQKWPVSGLGRVGYSNRWVSRAFHRHFFGRLRTQIDIPKRQNLAEFGQKMTKTDVKIDPIGPQKRHRRGSGLNFGGIFGHFRFLSVTEVLPEGVGWDTGGWAGTVFYHPGPPGRCRMRHRRVVRSKLVTYHRLCISWGLQRRDGIFKVILLWEIINGSMMDTNL